MCHVECEHFATDCASYHQDITCSEVLLLLFVKCYLNFRPLERERNRLALDEIEFFRIIKQGHVHTTAVRTIIMHDFEAGIGNLGIIDKVLKHKAVLDFTHSQNGVVTTVVILHRPDNLCHILHFLCIFLGSPVVLAVRKILLVIFRRIIIDIEEILKIVESDYMALRPCVLRIRHNSGKQYEYEQIKSLLHTYICGYRFQNLSFVLSTRAALSFPRMASRLG